MSQNTCINEMNPEEISAPRSSPRLGKELEAVRKLAPTLAWLRRGEGVVARGRKGLANVNVCVYASFSKEKCQVASGMQLGNLCDVQNVETEQKKEPLEREDASPQPSRIFISTYLPISPCKLHL